MNRRQFIAATTTAALVAPGIGFGAESKPVFQQRGYYLFFLFQVFNTDRDWSVPGALTTPGLVQHRAEHGRLDAKKRALLREQLTRVRAIAERHRDTSSDGARDLYRIAQWLADQWTSENTPILTTP